MIDEKKLIESLKTDFYDHYSINHSTDEKDLFEMFIDNINEQPKLNEWIPIEKELPKTKGEYLVSYHPCCWDDVSKEIRVGLDSFKGKSSWAKKKYQKVIAWMQLPKPYGGNEK